MDFELDEDQQLLRDAARDIITKECSPAFVRSIIDDGADANSWWSTVVSLDWPALSIAEADGGMGFGAVESVLLCEELGRAIDPSPFIATTTQFAPLIAAVADDTQAKRWLSSVASGSLIGAAAFDTTVHVSEVQASAAADGTLRLDGKATGVIDGARADAVAVVATLEGRTVVIVVDETSITERVETVSFDPTVQVATLRFDGVIVDADRLLGDRSADQSDGVARSVATATVGWAAATVGASQRILDLVIDHVQQRQQFGVAIGSFQAVKHKVVDMYVTIERARALVQFAALTSVAGDRRAIVAASMAKAAAGDAQRIAYQHGFQLFGGMGFTWENDLNFALRRAKIGAVLFGTTAQHRQIVAKAALAGEVVS